MNPPPPSDVLERSYTVGGGGLTPPPPLLPFQCLRLTAKLLLQCLQCQEDLSFKNFGRPSAGTIGGPREEGGGSQPTPPPPLSDPPPSNAHPPGVGRPVGASGAETVFHRPLPQVAAAPPASRTRQPPHTGHSAKLPMLFPKYGTNSPKMPRTLLIQSPLVPCHIGGGGHPPNFTVSGNHFAPAPAREALRRGRHAGAGGTPAREARQGADAATVSRGSAVPLSLTNAMFPHRLWISP